MKNHILGAVVAMALVLCCMPARAASPVRRDAPPVATQGLDGYTIALWNSHGRYYNLDRDQWLWQRAHLMETIEDLYTSSYVIDLLVPMLENAGAYVMMPRERDLSPVEVIIDHDSHLTPGYTEHPGSERFSQAGVKGFAMPKGALGDRENPFHEGSVRKVRTVGSPSKASFAEYNAEIPESGTYTIYISFASLPESSSAVRYTVNSLLGAEDFIVDQTMGGGTWIRLGEFPLAVGLQEAPIVSVSNAATGTNVGKTVTLDAVKIGGGMGNVARGNQKEPTVSGMPRWMEGSRYWLQWAGAPVDVYSPKDYENDYGDDFNSRPLWVNWLIGGSPRLPREKGLKIPVDISIALHSDAGITPDSTIVGTLGIYSTDGGRRLGDGRKRTTNGDLTNAIVDQIVDDVRALHDPVWEKRKTRNKKYAEARIPEIPAALIEMLSHQNFADMRHGLNPQFRFDMSRAIYKGILKYRAKAAHTKYAVQPLPVNSFAIRNAGNGKYRLSWAPTEDPLEPSATPTRYIIERREQDGVFKPIAETESTSFTYEATEGVETSLRIIAANSGGRSFPSEVLSLYRLENGNPEVLIVNGFTRISAPDWIDADSIAGFLDEIDYGVPYIRNIAYAGRQYDFDRESKWEDDIEHPGFGASRSEYDGRIIAGNTFDYPAVHGRAIAAAGYPYISASLEGYVNSYKSYEQPILDLILGKQKEIRPGHADCPTRFKAFPAGLQKAIAAHVGKGRNLLVSGEFIATDIYANPFSNDSTIQADIAFAAGTLGIDHESSFASTSGNLAGCRHWSNDNRAMMAKFSAKPNEHVYAAGSTDAIAPSGRGESEVLFQYAESGLPAAICSRLGNSGVIALGFPFEAVFSESERCRMMENFLNYLTPLRRDIAPRIPDMEPVDIGIVIPTPSLIKPSKLK